MKINSFKFQSIAYATHAWMVYVRTVAKKMTHTCSHIEWNLKNVFGFFICKLSPALVMTTMMKQKGNQNKTIFSFVYFACVHTDYSNHLAGKWANIQSGFFVRHTFDMSVSALCGIHYAGTGFKMCRICSFEMVIMNIIIYTRMCEMCSVFLHIS